MSLWKKLFGVADEKPAKPRPTRPEPKDSQAYHFAVVGESNYQDAIKRVTGGPGWEGPGFLVAEPKNKYDKNAVRVDIGGKTVGYLARELAEEFQPGILRLGGRYAATAKCTGGTKSKSSLGIVVQFDPRPLR